MNITQRLLNLILARRYQVTDHAIESMDEDDLTLNDVIFCLSTGRVRQRGNGNGSTKSKGEAWMADESESWPA